ncbi:MAG: hypothetical protein R3E10_07425 [Gemmatimonadota bacterium]
MPQRDFILRLIEEMGRALAEIRRRILGGELSGPRVREEVDRALVGVGLDLDLALRASPETLELMIASTGEVDPTRAWVLAESLYVYGLGAEAEGQTHLARTAFERAHRLFTLLAPSAAFYGLVEAEGRQEELEERLRSLADG